MISDPFMIAALAQRDLDDAAAPAPVNADSSLKEERDGNDDPADVDAEDDDEGRHDIGQHMADQDLARGGAHGLGCQKVIILFNNDHGAS